MQKEILSPTVQTTQICMNLNRNNPSYAKVLLNITHISSIISDRLIKIVPSEQNKFLKMIH